MSQTLIIAISLRPDGSSVSAKGFLPQTGTANKELLKNCPTITKQFLFLHNNVKLPSAPALASGEAACVTWKKPLTCLSRESVFSELLRFGLSLIPQVRPGNAWGFSSGGAALQLSIPCWGEHFTTITPPLHLSSACELQPSDSSRSGNASSCPYPAFAAGRDLAGLWHRAGVRSWDLLTWGLTGLRIGRRAVLRWLLTASPHCCGGGSQPHRKTKQLRVAGVSGGQSNPPALAAPLKVSCPGGMWVSWI